jgi:hypothetical protein
MQHLGDTEPHREESEEQKDAILLIFIEHVLSVGTVQVILHLRTEYTLRNRDHQRESRLAHSNCFAHCLLRRSTFVQYELHQVSKMMTEQPSAGTLNTTEIRYLRTNARSERRRTSTGS